MKLILQFPIADSRKFISNDTGLLSKPVWPIPEPYKDFMRYIGEIKERSEGGVSGWIGENVVSDASRGIRFEYFPSYYITRNNSKFRFNMLFRRYYHDGLALAKYELGIKIFPSDVLSIDVNELQELIYYLLRTPVTTPQIISKETQLIQVAKHLAKLTLISTTEQTFLAENSPDEWWVMPCRPLLILDTESEKELDLPFPGASKHQNFQSRLSHYRIPFSNQHIPMWVIDKKKSSSTANSARSLRISLMRFYAERECLKQILRNIGSKRLDIQPYSPESEHLQHYINSCTKRIFKISSKHELYREGDLYDQTLDSIDALIPGEQAEILDALERINMRHNIFRKAQDFSVGTTYDPRMTKLSFPAIDKVDDEILLSWLQRAIPLLNLDYIDLAIFELAKIFEQLARECFFTEDLFDSYKRDREKPPHLAALIDILAKAEVIQNKEEAVFLKVERNLRAHEIPPLHQRETLMRHAPFLIDLYLKHIVELHNRIGQ